MKAQLTKFLLAATAFAALCVAIARTRDEAWLTAWFLLLLFGELPVLILTWAELARALRNAPSRSPWMFALGVVFGLPQALFGLIALASGLGIIGWVLYNSLVARQPQYVGGWLTFGSGPVLVLFGAYWVRDAFTRQRAEDVRLEASNDEAGEREPPG